MKLIRYAALLFIQHLLCITAFAQTKEIDSLKKLWPGLKDTAQINCLHHIGVLYLCKNRNRDSAILYTNILLDKIQHSNDPHAHAITYLQKSFVASVFDNDVAQTKLMVLEALKWFERSSDKKEMDYVWGQLCSAISNLDSYDEAVSRLNHYYELGKRTNNRACIWSSLESLTDVYRESGEYDKLLETQQKIIQYEKKDDKTGSYTTHELWVMGLMYRLLEEYSIALPFWRKLFFENVGGFGSTWNQMEYAELLTQAHQLDSALNYYNLFDTTRAVIGDLRTFLTSKGEYFLFLKQYTTALPYFQKGLILHQQVKDRKQIKRTLLDIGKTYTALQQNDSAISYARAALTLALQTNARASIRDAYEILFTVYDRLHQGDSAYYYYHNYITMKEAVMGDQTKGKIAAYNYEHKIELLDKEKQLQQQQLTQAAMQKKFLLFSIIGIIALGVIILINILLKRKNEINRRKLAENELQLQKLEAERIKSEFHQKTTDLEMQALRAQMNPHFIFNSLNSINRFILQNNKLQASEYLTKFSRLVRLILQNSQAPLIPLDSELEALQLYLELEALRFDNHFDYTINVDEDIDSSTLKVPPLIIQPYAENAIWHGLMNKQEKGHLAIDIAEQQDTLLCKITDNGVGRQKAAELKSKSAATHKSMGMSITADRIAMLKQKKPIESYITINDLILPDGKAAGTEVTLKLPLFQ